MADKVIIIGKGQRSEVPQGERWGINDVNAEVDLIFDMHPTSDPITQGVLRRARVPVMTLDEYSAYPQACKYPLESIIEYFGTDYFGCGIDYMLAYAIYSKYTEIALYGVNLKLGTEHMFEKPSVEYWIGQAHGRGIKVTIDRAGKSELLKTKDSKLYGYGRKQGG